MNVTQFCNEMDEKGGIYAGLFVLTLTLNKKSLKLQFLPHAACFQKHWLDVGQQFEFNMGSLFNDAWLPINQTNRVINPQCSCKQIDQTYHIEHIASTRT